MSSAFCCRRASGPAPRSRRARSSPNSDRVSHRHRLERAPSATSAARSRSRRSSSTRPFHRSPCTTSARSAAQIASSASREGLDQIRRSRRRPPDSGARDRVESQRPQARSRACARRVRPPNRHATCLKAGMRRSARTGRGRCRPRRATGLRSSSIGQVDATCRGPRARPKLPDRLVAERDCRASRPTRRLRPPPRRPRSVEMLNVSLSVEPPVPHVSITCADHRTRSRRSPAVHAWRSPRPRRSLPPSRPSSLSPTRSPALTVAGVEPSPSMISTNQAASISLAPQSCRRPAKRSAMRGLDLGHADRPAAASREVVAEQTALPSLGHDRFRMELHALRSGSVAMPHRP